MSQPLHVSLKGGKYLIDQSSSHVGQCGPWKIVQKESCKILYVPDDIKIFQGTGGGMIVKIS